MFNKRLFLTTILSTVIFANIAFAGQIKTSETTAKSGDTVSVPVIVNTDTGLCSFGVFLTYDKNVLTPVSYKKSNFDGVFVANLNYFDDTVMVTGADSKNTVSGDVELFKVDFKIKENAQAGYTNITLSPQEIAYIDGQSVKVTNVTDGDFTIKIENESSQNKEPAYSKNDADKVLKYVLNPKNSLSLSFEKADITGDKIIDSNDVAEIIKLSLR